MPSPPATTGQERTAPARLSVPTAVNKSNGAPSVVRSGSAPVFTRTVRWPPEDTTR